MFMRMYGWQCESVAAADLKQDGRQNTFTRPVMWQC